MFSYFLNNNIDPTDYVIKKYTRFEYFQRRYRHELDRVVSYYKLRERAVNNRHILSRLVNMIAPNINLDDVTYLKIVTATAKYVSKQFGITSTINYGVAHESIFYGYNSTELLIYKESSIDIEYVSHNYDSVVSVKPIYLEDTDLDYYVPMGTKDLRKPSLAVFELDIVMMLMQYKYWALDRTYSDLGTNPNVFIATVVIPNMVYQTFDLALWNRFVAIHRTERIPQFAIKHPFPLLNFDTKVDDIYRDIDKFVSDDIIPLGGLLDTIPAAYSETMNNVLEIDIKYYTAQSEWVIWLSRIFVINDLIDILGEKGRIRNVLLINELPVKMRLLDNRSTRLEGMLPEVIYERYVNTINGIKLKVGKR